MKSLKTGSRSPFMTKTQERTIIMKLRNQMKTLNLLIKQVVLKLQSLREAWDLGAHIMLTVYS
jgi:hypothetical protein